MKKSNTVGVNDSLVLEVVALDHGNLYTLDSILPSPKPGFTRYLS